MQCIKYNFSKIAIKFKNQIVTNDYYLILKTFALNMVIQKLYKNNSNINFKNEKVKRNTRICILNVTNKK